MSNIEWITQKVKSYLKSQAEMIKEDKYLKDENKKEQIDVLVDLFHYVNRYEAISKVKNEDEER